MAGRRRELRQFTKCVASLLGTIGRQCRRKRNEEVTQQAGDVACRPRCSSGHAPLPVLAYLLNDHGDHRGLSTAPCAGESVDDAVVPCMTGTNPLRRMYGVHAAAELVLSLGANRTVDPHVCHRNSLTGLTAMRVSVVTTRTAKYPEATSSFGRGGAAVGRVSPQLEPATSVTLSSDIAIARLSPALSSWPRGPAFATGTVAPPSSDMRIEPALQAGPPAELRPASIRRVSTTTRSRLRSIVELSPQARHFCLEVLDPVDAPLDASRL